MAIIMKITITLKKILTLILFVISVILFSIGTIAAINIYITLSPVKFSWDSEGFSNFFTWFDFSIKFYAASIALLTLAITSMRAFQFDKNIELLSDNNKFNNFYKHRDEFINFTKDFTFFQLYQRSPDQVNQLLILPFYDEYFYKKYNDFEPSLNDDAIDEIEKFYNAFEALQIENKDLSNLEIELLEKVNKTINPRVDDYLSSIIHNRDKSLDNYFTTKSFSTKEKKEIKLREKILFKIYYTLLLYQALLAFDGKHQPWDYDFLNRYEHYLKNSDFYKK